MPVSYTHLLELADQLHDAVKYSRGTYQEAALPELGEGEDIDESLPADPNVKNYSYTAVSYTHLDVYKRQPRKLPCCRTPRSSTWTSTPCRTPR